MNTLDNLLDNGIVLKTAYMMLEEYSSKIGTINGVYEIVDINYDFGLRAKDVLLKCTKCGKTIHRFMKTGRNKWSELIKTCECQKAEKELERQKKIEILKRESEKLKKLKKEQFEKELVSMIGGTFGDFEILEVADEKGFYLKCNDCGMVIYMTYEKIKRGLESNKICKCKRKQFEYDESYVGNKYNYLTVLGIVRDDKNAKAFKCQCDCGEIVNFTPCHVVKGIVKSCGCKHDELLSESIKKHGYSGTRIYNVYNGMRERCFNKNNPNYNNYGGRGISVCPEWLGENGLKNFIKWAYETGYNENAERGKCTIDRIDVNGNYEPSNCRWISIEEQNKNKRPSSEWKKREGSYEYGGKMYSLTELCNIFNISAPTVAYRIKEKGMSLEEALKMPKIQSGRPRKEVVNA